jgi:hypothetical protein
MKIAGLICCIFASDITACGQNGRKMKQKNTIKRAIMVQKLLAEHYRPGRHDKCKLSVYRNVISKIYPMSRATFFRYLAVREKEPDSEACPRQLSLFD